MKFGSVCSGIEAASVAWHPLGWQAAWLSEIEPFPSAVLAHHYPTVPNLGDMTLLPERIASGEVEAPDLFCGGTPCQAFSVAGLRQSLDDDRGNLSLTFVEIANAIDSRRLDAGHVPAIIFWENVPGVLNTKDNAFGCFLGALAGEDAPLEPAGKRWTNAGCVYGPQRTVAWRVLDAQYFGVAQRRRRVFVVASARDDFDPAAVLFESEGVRRDTAPRRETGQRVAPCVTNGPPFSRTGNERVEAEAMVVAAQSKQWPADIASTIDTTFGTKQGLENQHVNSGCPMFVPATYDMKQHHNPQTSSTVQLTTKNCSFVRGDTPLVQPIPLPAVAQPIASIDASGSNPAMHQGGAAIVSPTLTASNDPSRSPQSTEVTNQVAAIHAVSMAVRRLTPTECERLQGFPDGYTNIPWRKKPESPDGPRYKALGNSWAVPVVAWIGRRIEGNLS